MTITKLNNAEGGTNGASVTTGNSGGTSGTAWDLVSAGTGGAITYDTGSARHGSLGYKCAPASGQLCVMRWTGFNATTGVVRFYYADAGNPPATEGICAAYTSTGTRLIQISAGVAGTYVVQDSANTILYNTTATRQAGDRLELSWTVGTTTSNGSWSFAFYRADSTTAVETASGATANFGTTNWDRVQFGKMGTDTDTVVKSFDDLAAASGTTTFFGPAASPPTASFTSSESALTLSVDGTGSTAVSPATISGYDWDWGDGSTHGTGSTASHTYAAAGTYTVVLTVTDSNSLTNASSQSITVAAPTGSVTAQSVNVSTGWTPSSGTVLSCITDGDPTTFDSSSSPPTAQEFDFTLQALSPPSSGQPLKVFLTMDALTASSASLNAQLFEGTTQRSSLTGIAIPAGSGSSVTGVVTLTFPWTDVQNVTTGGWNALKVKLQVTAS